MLKQAQRYTRRLALAHYENFIVGGCLTPRSLRQDFYNLYAYCRTADDLADELGDPQESLRRLDQWQGWLEDCYQGNSPPHPIFIALHRTIDRHRIPIDPLRDLLVAFRQDQSVTQYEDFPQLLEYCRYSANPVGHLVLYLGGSYGPSTVPLADHVCSALQLANFWQDIRRDALRERIYVPRTVLSRYGVAPALLSASVAPAGGTEMLTELVAQTREMFYRGLPLAAAVPGWLGRNVRMFVGGGLAVLEAIARQGYDVWDRRPVVSRWKQLGLMTRVALGKKHLV